MGKLEYWIQTISGRVFDLKNPDSNYVNLLDIASSLSKQCRYNGNIKNFYSVAEHCVVGSYLDEIICEGTQTYSSQEVIRSFYFLLHDAHESIVGDIISPVEHLILNEIRDVLKKYDIQEEIDPIGDLKRRVDSAIYEYFNIPEPSIEVKEWIDYRDLQMFNTERIQKIGDEVKPWLEDGSKYKPLDVTLSCWMPFEAELAYIQRFKQLYPMVCEILGIKQKHIAGIF